MKPSNYYFFSPMLDENGEQVVRKPKEGEFFSTNHGEMYCARYEPDYKFDVEIFTLCRFEQDPFGKIAAGRGEMSLKNIRIVDGEEIHCCLTCKYVMKDSGGCKKAKVLFRSNDKCPPVWCPNPKKEGK
jgi:hypothetical protein